jgi:hypothetical protein
MSIVEIEEDDIVLVMSDGVVDNLWEHEVVENVVDSIHKWESGEGGPSIGDRKGGRGGGMRYVAKELVKAARVIAEDPFAESPFMERAIEEGLAMEGGRFSYFANEMPVNSANATLGKLDDISVVAAVCKRSNG